MIKVNEVPLAFTALLSKARVKHFPKSQIILYLGDTPTDVYILKSGIVKIHDVDEQGNDKILHILSKPAVMPFIFFSASNKGTNWFYTCLTDCDLYILSQTTLRRHMAGNADLTNYLLSWFSLEVHEILVRLSSLGKTNVQDKVVAALKFLAVCHGIQRRSGWRRVSFPVNHQFIADLVGITRESAAITMKELQDEGIVRNPRLTILEINFDRVVNGSI